MVARAGPDGRAVVGLEDGRIGRTWIVVIWRDGHILVHRLVHVARAALVFNHLWNFVHRRPRGRGALLRDCGDHAGLDAAAAVGGCHFQAPTRPGHAAV